MEGNRQAPHLVIRLQRELKDALKHKAIDNRRSLNNEVVVRLEESLAREQQPQGAQQ